MNITSALRAHTIQNFMIKEKKRIMDSFALDPTIEHRAITKITKRILLDGPYFLRGEYWEVVAKSLGAGVYSLKLNKRR